MNEGSFPKEKRFQTGLFYLVLCMLLIWFLFQAFYFAFTAKYGISPDERYHFELSNIYSQSESILIRDEPATYVYGAISTMPFLYYLLMGKSLYFNVFHLDPLIFLRCINIFISALSFIVSYRLVKEINTNKFFILGCLIVQSNLLMYVFLSSMVSYDNLTNLLAVSSIYGLIKFLKSYSRVYLELFILSVSAGMLTKITFGPLAVILFTILSLNCKKIFQNAGIWMSSRFDVRDIILSLFIIVLLGLNMNLYLTNLIKYHQASPSCDKVLSYENCLASGIFARNEKFRETRQEREEISFAEFVPRYFYQLVGSIIGIYGEMQMRKSHDEKMPYYILIFFSGLIYLIKFREITANKYAGYMLFISFFYLGVLFCINYITYRKLLIFGLALQGRYVFPVIVPVIASFIYPLFLGKNKLCKALFLCLISMIFMEGSFFYFFSNATERWLVQ